MNNELNVRGWITVEWMACGLLSWQLILINRMIRNIKNLIVGLSVVGLAVNVSAISLNSTNADLFGSDYHTSNPGNAALLSALESEIGEFEEVYKGQVAGSDEGDFKDNYNATFDNSSTDPQDADIVFDLSSFPFNPIIGDSIWVVAKDGNHAPYWYAWDITGWNGVETIEISGLWPDRGSISYVSIVAGDGTSVPDNGGTLVFLGAALGLCALIPRFSLLRN